LAVHAPPADDAGADGVSEHPVHGALPRRVPQAVPEALFGERLGERVKGLLAGRVAFEGPHDERGLLVGLEHRLAAAARAIATDVPVAEGRSGRPAALGGLLVHALADLLREVRRVELRDRGEDPRARGLRLASVSDPTRSSLSSRGSPCCSRSSSRASILLLRRGTSASVGASPRRSLKGHVGTAGRGIGAWSRRGGCDDGGWSRHR